MANTATVGTTEGTTQPSGTGADNTATDTDNIVQVLPVFSKVFSPDSIAPGGTSTLTFTINNTGSLVSATSLDFTDNLPTGVVIAPAPNDSTTCGGTPTATAGAGTVSFTGGTVGASASCTVTVDVTSSAVAAHENTSGALESSAGTSGTAIDTLTVTAQALPVFSKVFSPDSIVPGGTSTLTFTINNAGSLVSATSLDFTDNLPTGVVVAPTPNDSTTCGGTPTAPAGAGTVSFTGGTVGASASCTVTVDVMSSAVAAHENTSGALESSAGTSGTAIDTLTVTAQALPVFSKVFSPDSIVPGGTSTLTFTINNAGSLVSATSLDFTDNLPTGVVVAPTPNDSTTCGGTPTAPAGAGTVSFTGGTVGASASCTVTVDVTSSAVAAHENTSGALESSAGTSSTATDTLTVTGAGTPGVSISKGPDTQQVISGMKGTFSITVRNTGDVALTGVQVTDPSTADCVRTLADLAVGADFTFSCETVGLTTGFTNTATVSANSTGGTVTASDTAAVTVVAPDITITKTPATQTVPAGGTASFTITVTNPMATGTLTGVSVTDAETPACSMGAESGGVGIPNLGPGDMHSYTCVSGVVGADFTNVAVVSATFMGSTLTASASADVEVVSAVEITKDPEQQNVSTGGTATFTITVTAGATALTGVEVTDPLTPACDNTIGSLAASTSTMYTCTTSGLTSDLTNVATVNATAGTTAVSDNDSALVVVAQQSVSITKTPTAQQVAPGSTATFTIMVTNNGPLGLTNLAVSDPLTPSCDRAVGTLPATLANGQSTMYDCTTGALTTDLTNVATVTAEVDTGGSAPASTVTASATAEVNVANPIDITKTPATQTVTPGATATFTITVTNDGDLDVTGLVVTDPLTAACARAAGMLPDLPARGGVTTYQCTTDALTAGFTNVATVTAMNSGGTVTSSASAVVDVTGVGTPSVSISKGPDTQEVISGMKATFSIAVRNTGDVALTGVQVSDPSTADCVRTLADLAVGADFSFSCETVELTTGFTNTATVSATSSTGEVSASDTAAVTVVAPDITITKTPATQTVPAGGTASFTITVTNPMATGILTGVSVTDAETLACSMGAESGGVGIPDLGPGDMHSYTCASGIVGADFTNVAVASATFMGATLTASASASADVDVVSAVEITKDPEQQNVSTGGTATFTITVTAGATALTGITVTDPATPACDHAVPNLAAFESSTPYTCVTPALTSNLTNTATVNATAGTTAVSGNDSALVVVVPQSVTITKTPTAQLVAPGSTATFTITVTNNGPLGLTNLAVSDPLTPSCDRAVGTLPATLANGQSTSYACTTGALTTDLTNVATVTAEVDAGGSAPASTVTASATAEVNVANPIDITKTPATQTVTTGATATFTITVTNDGDLDVTGLVVTDPLTAACARAAGMLPDLPARGGVTTYECTTGALTAGFTNVATVTAMNSGGTVTSSASAVVDVTAPSPNCLTELTATGTGLEEVCLEGGGLTCQFSASAANLASDLGTPPVGVAFPHGLVSFTASGCTPGASVQFTATYPAVLAPGTIFYKFGPEPGNTTPHFFAFPATIVGNTATFVITDGGVGDSDGVANGTIVDPAGPGAAAVPTLPQWALIVLALLLGFYGVVALKRRAGDSV